MLKLFIFSTIFKNARLRSKNISCGRRIFCAVVGHVMVVLNFLENSDWVRLDVFCMKMPQNPKPAISS
jgi:hypothetical protein